MTTLDNQQIVATPSWIFVEWLVGHMGVSCDYANNNWCCKSKAEWVLFIMCPTCLYNGVRLAGTGCKDLFMETDELLECPACTEPQPVREFLRRIEAL